MHANLGQDLFCCCLLDKMQRFWRHVAPQGRGHANNGNRAQIESETLVTFKRGPISHEREQESGQRFPRQLGWAKYNIVQFFS